MIDLDVSEVEFSKWDRFFKIFVPNVLTAELAYETGVHIGDGHLAIKKRTDGTMLYDIEFSGHGTDEKEFYEETVHKLVQLLYNKDARITKGHGNTITLRYKSQAIATFKNRVLGLPSGKKTGRVRIPKIIMDSPLGVKKLCLAGIVDTDFSLNFKRWKYPCVSAEFPAQCKQLVNDILEIFSELDIRVNEYPSHHIEKRYGPARLYNQIGINFYTTKNLEIWMQKVGFLSQKHLTKYLVWKKYGIYRPYTTLEERKCLLASVAQLVER